MTFGKRFLDLIEAMNARIPDIARDLGKDKSTFNHWKKRKKPPSGAVKDLADYFLIPLPVMAQYFEDGEPLPPQYETGAQWRARQVEREAGRRLLVSQGQVSPPSPLEMMLSLARHPESELKEAFRHLSESAQNKLRAVVGRSQSPALR